MAKVTKKEKKEAKKAALTLVKTEKPANKEVKPEESTEEGDPEPATEEKTVDVEVKPELSTEEVENLIKGIYPDSGGKSPLHPLNMRCVQVKIDDQTEEVTKTALEILNKSEKNDADGVQEKDPTKTGVEFTSIVEHGERVGLKLKITAPEGCENPEEAEKAIVSTLEDLAKTLDPTAEISISHVPDALTKGQINDIARIGEDGNESAATIEEADEAIAALEARIGEKKATFIDFVNGDKEIPEDMDDETKAAIIQAQKHLPRNIMCQGCHAYCSINEMSKDKPRYSINFLKKKGLIK